MKKVRINFEDCWFNDYRESLTMSFFIEELNKIAEIEISNNPEFLICSCFGRKAMLSDCCKIFFAGENVIPDFNVYDYGIGFSDISFGDRYLRMPLYFFYHDDFMAAIKKNSTEKRYKFCNMVVSNSLYADEMRTKFFYELSKYKQVDSGGKYLNNIGEPVKDKYEFQKNYKFSMAFENSSFPGYVTEKIVQAWAAGTIPIYWGAPDIAHEFNEDAFINAYNRPIDDVIEEIIRIDQNDELYESIRRETIYSTNEKKRVNQYLDDALFLDFMKNILYQEKPKRLCENGSFEIYANRMKKRVKAEYSGIGQAIIKAGKIIRG